EERKAELESRIAQNREDIEDTREKLARQEFEFISANEQLEALTRRIIDQENQLAEHEERSRGAKAEREAIEATLRESRSEANRTQSLVASHQARIESALSQLEGTRERSRQLAEEDERLGLEIEEYRADQQRLAQEVSENS